MLRGSNINNLTFFFSFYPVTLIDEITKDLKLKKQSVKGLAAWMVSKCSRFSQRELLIKEIRNFISVDIYGKCGYRRDTFIQ